MSPSNASSLILGNSPLLNDVLDAARRVGPTRLSILIGGETGTGKELLARLVHGASGREGAFVTVNCGALAENLLEAELFGHRRGAYTGAIDHRPGLILSADRGSLFLDEVGEMSPAFQVKLLRFLETGTFFPVGSEREQKADVRVIAATHRDLSAWVREGRFRADLLHRLTGYELHLPPLAERLDDIPVLARRFLAEEAVLGAYAGKKLTNEALVLLRSCSWPGNIRQLRSVVQRAAVDARGSTIDAGDLRGHVEGMVAEPASSGSTTLTRMGRGERAEAILGLLAAKGSMKTEELCAALLVSRATLNRDLRPLVAAGRVVTEGRSVAVRYRIALAGEGVGEEAIVEPAETEESEGVENRAAPPDERWAKVEAILAADGRITRARFLEAVGGSARSATRFLAKLVDESKLRIEGNGRKTSYIMGNNLAPTRSRFPSEE